MNKKVFISGSINIDKIPEKLISSLERIKQNNLGVLIGDAEGIDSAVQNYFSNSKYYDVKVYTIYDKPRHRKSNNFSIKIIEVDDAISREREKQSKKDEAMTNDSDFSLVIWDGKSKGSYHNILRSIEQNKLVKVFLSYENDFLPQNKVNKLEIEYIFSENNGYTSSELLEQIELLGINKFKNTREINKYLVDSKIIYRDNNDVYLPTQNNPEHFKIKMYRGKSTGVLFTNKFVEWLSKELNLEYSDRDQATFDF